MNLKQARTIQKSSTKESQLFPETQPPQAERIFHNIKAIENFSARAIRSVDPLLYIREEGFSILGASHRRLEAVFRSLQLLAEWAEYPSRIFLSAIVLLSILSIADSRRAISGSIPNTTADSVAIPALEESPSPALPLSEVFSEVSSEALAPQPAAPPHTDNSMTPVKLDPLDSPYPVPWNWIMAVLTEAKADATPRFRYYRSPSLISPDGEYAAYSRIQVELATHFTQSRVASVLFIENLKTGDLQTITASSPFADNPFMAEADPEEGGQIAILIPIAWSESGDRVLAREFESIFGSDIASDFAVVWHRSSNVTRTIAPTQVNYSNAVLLGWSQTDPNQVLFRAGTLGDPEWSLYAVDANGQTRPVAQDQPIVFGQLVNSIWAGPQAYARP